MSIGVAEPPGRRRIGSEWGVEGKKSWTLCQSRAHLDSYRFLLSFIKSAFWYIKRETQKWNTMSGRRCQKLCLYLVSCRWPLVHVYVYICAARRLIYHFCWETAGDVCALFVIDDCRRKDKNILGTRTGERKTKTHCRGNSKASPLRPLREHRRRDVNDHKRFCRSRCERPIWSSFDQSHMFP